MIDDTEDNGDMIRESRGQRADGRPERRAAPRYFASEPVEIQITPNLPGRQPETWSGLIVNASTTGMALRIQSDRADWIDMLALSSVRIRLLAETVLIAADVAWCAGSTDGFFCGLQVSNEDPEALASWVRWVKLLRASSEKTLAGTSKKKGPHTEQLPTLERTQRSAAPRADEERFGRYKLLRRLARGGMAEVFLASYSPNPDFDKLVALKRILPNLSRDAHFVQMFRREARIASQLAHANVVQVFDFGQVEGLWFLAMEYVEGWNLDQVLSTLTMQGRTMPRPLAIYVAREIVRGLAYAHGAQDRRGNLLGVIHRDLNPPNVLLSKNGEVKIADFGVAQVYPNLPAGEDFKGKVSYLAPEVIKGEPLDQRTDLWALGIMLYELFTGAKPLGLGSGPDLEKLRKIVEDPHESVRLEVPDLPVPLIVATDMLLAKDPAERPESAEEVGVILDTLVNPAEGRLLPAFLEDLLGSAT